MVKHLFIFLILFLMLSSFSFAKGDADDKVVALLQKEYGRDLTHAPFFLRFTFLRQFDKDWKDSDYLERKVFLENYASALAQALAKEKEEARAQAEQEKQLKLEKKQELIKERERLKAKLAQEKAEKQADEQRQKAFNALIRTQEKELKELQQEAAESK